MQRWVEDYVWAWINEPEALWWGTRGLIMNRLRQKDLTHFRQVINEPETRLCELKSFCFRCFAETCPSSILGMITDGPSHNHSWATS